VAVDKKAFFLFFIGSKEHFSFFFVQYLGVTAGIEPAKARAFVKKSQT
jgi:hypothetical protein